MTEKTSKFLGIKVPDNQQIYESVGATSREPGGASKEVPWITAMIAHAVDAPPSDANKAHNAEIESRLVDRKLVASGTPSGVAPVSNVAATLRDRLGPDGYKAWLKEKKRQKELEKKLAASNAKLNNMTEFSFLKRKFTNSTPVRYSVIPRYSDGRMGKPLNVEITLKGLFKFWFNQKIAAVKRFFGKKGD